MRRVRRLLLFPALTVVSALIWTTFGTFSTASGQTDEPPITIERTHTADLRPSFDEPIFVLAIGSDARYENPDRGAARADGLQIIAINPEQMKATIVGIPRDAFIDIPGHRQDKATHALFFRGIEGTVAAIEGLSGCRFHYHVLTAFQGFAGTGYRGPNSRGGLINDLGGLPFRIPAGGFTDADALGRKLDPLPAGEHVLDGAYALAWARSRKGPHRPRGDFDRSFGQGELMIAMLRKLRADFEENPATALRNLAAARRSIRMNIPVTEALQLGLLALQIRPADVTHIVVDGTIGSHPTAGSIVNITARGRSQLADVCADGILDNP